MRPLAEEAYRYRYVINAHADLKNQNIRTGCSDPDQTFNVITFLNNQLRITLLERKFLRLGRNVCGNKNANSGIRTLFDRIFTVFRERRSRVGQSVTAPPYSFSALNFSEVSKCAAESLKKPLRF